MLVSLPVLCFLETDDVITNYKPLIMKLLCNYKYPEQADRVVVVVKYDIIILALMSIHHVIELIELHKSI